MQRARGDRTANFELNPLIVRNDGQTAEAMPARSKVTTKVAARREMVKPYAAGGPTEARVVTASRANRREPHVAEIGSEILSSGNARAPTIS